MNRISYITVAGKPYPLHFSVAAAEAVTERYGGIGNVAQSIADGDEGKKLCEVIWLLSVLLSQGAQYMRIVEDADVRSWTEADLKVVFGIGDLPTLQRELLTAMTTGMAQTVEVAPAEDDGKNGEATPDTQVPRG